MFGDVFDAGGKMEIDLRGNRTAVTPTSSVSPISRPLLISRKHRSMQLCWGRNLTLLAALALAALVVPARGSVGVFNRGLIRRTAET